MTTFPDLRPLSARWMLPLLLASLVLFAACGDDGVSPPVIELPTVEAPIDNQDVLADSEAFTADLSTVFGDDDGSLSYSASTSNADVATAAVSEATLTVTPVGGGTAEITATASNDAGAANAQFTIQVNLPDPPTRP